MTIKFSRRGFAKASIGTAVTLTLVPTFAQANSYAHPELLVDPVDLMRGGTASEDGSTEAPLLIDIRTKDEYDAGHIPDAVWLDPNAVVADHSPVSGALGTPTGIAQILGALGISPQRRVVFYDDRGGFHAARMFWLLEYLGHRNVALMNGGLTNWTSAGGTLSTAPAFQQARKFHPAISPRRHASADDVLRQKGAKDAVLIDVRPPNMYAEGHVPWAVNIPWAENLDANGHFNSAGVLMNQFASHGVTPDTDVIMHCQNGLASSHSYVALRLLAFPRVRVYHRSWAEWGNDPSLPKATS